MLGASYFSELNLAYLWLVSLRYSLLRGPVVGLWFAATPRLVALRGFWIGIRLGWELAQDRIGFGSVATGPAYGRDGLFWVERLRTICHGGWTVFLGARVVRLAPLPVP